MDNEWVDARGRGGRSGGRGERASQTEKCRCAQMWTARKTHPPARDIPQVRRLIGTRRAHPDGVRGPPRSMKEHLPHVPLIQTTAFCFCCVFVDGETGERRKKKRGIDGSIVVMRYSRRYNPYCEKHREGDGFFFFYLSLTHSPSLSHPLFFYWLAQPNRAPLIRK